MTEKKEPKSTAPHVYQAIASIAGDLAKTGIAKDKDNKMQGYKFRGIDDIYNALAPLLSDHGLVILPRVIDREVTERQTKNGGALFYVVVKVDFDFVSAMDGTKHTITMLGEAMDSGDKATNKAMSAAYKYACLEAFCIPTEGDNDADATTHEVKAVDKKPAELTPAQKFLESAKAEIEAMTKPEQVHQWARDNTPHFKGLSEAQKTWLDKLMNTQTAKTAQANL